MLYITVTDTKHLKVLRDPLQTIAEKIAKTTATTFASSSTYITCLRMDGTQQSVSLSPISFDYMKELFFSPSALINPK